MLSGDAGPSIAIRDGADAPTVHATGAPHAIGLAVGRAGAPAFTAWKPLPPLSDTAGRAGAVASLVPPFYGAQQDQHQDDGDQVERDDEADAQNQD